MMYLFPLFITYFGYVITPLANQTPTYNLLYGGGGGEFHLHGWVLIVRPKEGMLG